MGKMVSSLMGAKKERDGDVSLVVAIDPDVVDNAEDVEDAEDAEDAESDVDAVDVNAGVGVGAGSDAEAVSESRRVFLGVAAIESSSRRAMASSRWLVLFHEKRSGC